MGPKGRGRGRPAGRGRSDSVPSSGKSKHEIYLEGLRAGGIPPRQEVILAYALENKGTGKPRTLERASLPIKNDNDIQSHLTASIGADPSGKLGDVMCSRPGLLNLGFTCYINSILQMLASDANFTAALLRLVSTNVPTIELQKIFAKLNTRAKQKWTDPTQLISSLEVCASEQQDAHEFYRLFTEYITNNNADESKNHNAFQKSIKHLLEGGTMYTMKCLECNTSTKRFEGMTELCVPLSGGRTATLEDCLQECFLTTDLAGENQYECGKCNAKRDGQRVTTVSKLPEMLVVVLGRFGYDKKKNTKIKKQTSVSFPRELDMGVYTDTPDVEVNYELTGTVHHLGTTPFRGHYVARCWDQDNDVWKVFDDTEVKVCPKYSREGDSISSNDVYLLLYTATDRELVDLEEEVTSENCAIKKAAMQELQEEEHMLDSRVSDYEARKERFVADAQHILTFNKEHAKRYKVENVNPDDLSRYCFVSNYWLYAFGHGKFINKNVDTVAINRPHPEAAKKQEIIFKNFSGSAKETPLLSTNDSDATVEVIAVDTQESHDTPMADDTEPTTSSGHLTIYRDPFDPRNFDIIACSHAPDGYFIDPNKVRKGAKLILRELGNVLKEAVGGSFEPNNAEELLCVSCVRESITSDDDRMRDGQVKAEMIALAEVAMHATDGAPPSGYWISVQWWNEFKKKNNADAEFLLKTDIFDNARCAHGELAVTTHARRLIPQTVFEYLVDTKKFHATEPHLVTTAKVCVTCQKSHDEETSSFNAIDSVKKQLKMSLRPLTDAVKTADTAAKLLSKDWMKEKRQCRSQWEKRISKLKKDDEAKKKKADAQRLEEEAASREDLLVQHRTRDPLKGGKITCNVCDKCLSVSSWAAHKTTESHKQCLQARGIEEGRVEYEHALMEIQEMDRRNAPKEEIDVDADASTEPSSSQQTPVNQRKGKKRVRSTDAFSGPNAKSSRHNPPQGDDAMEVDDDGTELFPEAEEEEEEEEEEESEDPYREPDFFVDNKYIMLEKEWVSDLVAWYQSATNQFSDVVKPGALNLSSLYCDHGHLKYDHRHYMGPHRSVRPEGFEKVKLDCHFVLIAEDCLAALRAADLLDESQRAVPKLRLTDGDDEMTFLWDPTPCAAGCCDTELMLMRERKINFVDGTVDLAPPKNAKRGKRISATIPGVCSEDTVLNLLWKINGVTDADPRMMELEYGELDLMCDVTQPLSTFSIENGGTITVKLLDSPNLHVASALGVSSETPSNTDRERGFASSRLANSGGGVTSPQKASKTQSYTCGNCTFINEGKCGPPCDMCGS